MMNSKMILYAVLPRLYDNRCTNPVVSGSIETNGCGKLAAFTEKALTAIQQLGATHIWYIGLVAHASQTDYSHVGIRPSTPAIVKGRAGSPYAIRDYYDVDPDLAKDPAQRMEEFHGLIERTHRAGMGFVMDFVPNHVAREYHSDTKPASVSDLGEGDDPQQVFSPVNCFYYFPDQALRLEITSPEAANYHEEPARASGNDCFSPHVGQ
ncbi:alpha-amylase family glycosyl hydrolase, partial [Porphyromonas loveana]